MRVSAARAPSPPPPLRSYPHPHPLPKEPEFTTLFVLARNLEGYAPAAAAARRESAAKLLTTMIQVGLCGCMMKWQVMV
jgi:hypothetical protein